MRYYYRGREQHATRSLGTVDSCIDLRIKSGIAWAVLKTISDRLNVPISPKDNYFVRHAHVYLFVKKDKSNKNPVLKHKLALAVSFIERELAMQNVEIFISHKRYPDYRWFPNFYLDDEFLSRL
jgi:hypothetical protein